ncbi:MAG: ABC transporter permease [Nanoarchaeota archaeon]
MVIPKEYIQYVWNNIHERKIRSWLTVLGVIIGIAAIVSLVTLSQGMNTAVQEQFEKMGISSIRVVPGGLHGPPTGGIALSLDLKEKIENVKGVEYANPVLIDYATAEFNNEEQTIMVNSYDTTLSEKAFLDTDLQIDEGRFFNPGEKGSVIIGYDIATDLFEQDIGVKNTIIINEEKFKVIGILEESGTDADDRIYMGREDAEILFNKKDAVNVFVIQTTSGIDTEKVGKKIEEELLKTMQEEEFDVFTPEQLLKQIGAMLGVIQIVLASIASISLVVGAIGIMNAMFTAVLERTQEIGVMKAIGATRETILLFFMVEAGVMGTAGGIIGTLIGTGISYMVEYGAHLAGYDLFKVTLDPTIIFGTIFFSFVIGAIAGSLPALRAARMKPVDALRYE